MTINEIQQSYERMLLAEKKHLDMLRKHEFSKQSIIQDMIARSESCIKDLEKYISNCQKRKND